MPLALLALLLLPLLLLPLQRPRVKQLRRAMAAAGRREANIAAQRAPSAPNMPNL
jgi:hypothetical protein